MIWRVRQWLTLFFRALILISYAFASVKLDCNGNKLQGLCPSVNEQRMCTCVTSGNTLRWSTTQAGVCFTAPSVSRFSSADPVGRSAAHTMGITAVLTNNTEGQLTSILIFKPSVMSATGLKIKVSCENPSTGEGLGNTLTVAYSDSPKIRQFASFSVTCDTSNGTYRASVTFNDDETGDSDINYYNGTVTSPSGFSSQFNVTTNTVVITGLHCSTSYNIDVTAVNCAGVSTVKAASFTTPQPDLSTFAITSACLDSSSKIRVEWMPPSITSCCSITGYFLSVVNNVSQPVSFATVTEETSLSVLISNISTYYNITIYAITNYKTITTTSNGSFTLWSDNKCVMSIPLFTSSTTLSDTPIQTNVKATLLTTSNVEYQSCQVGLACLGVAFFTFLLTAIISIPLTFLITCFTMKRKKPDVCPSEQMVSLRTDDVSPADGSKMSMNSVTSEDVEPNS